MSAPVDLTNLRSMTDGDAAMERELFEEFYLSFEAGMASLQSHMQESTFECWRKEAHALKGIALNLGAEHLGNLCKMAQEAYHGEEAEKNCLLKKISQEYDEVKKFLLKSAV